jgi:nicotinamide-nucleotide amidase
LINDLMGAGRNPEVGLLASPGEIKIRITANAEGETKAEALIGPVEEEIRSRLGSKIFGVDDETIEGVIDTLLRKSRFTLAILETFSGGLAAQRLHRIPSSRLRESRVIPDRERLLSLLGDRGGSVNIQTTTTLARKMREMAEVDVALAIVGFPENSETNPVIHAFAASSGDRFKNGFSWRMGGGLRAFQERGAAVGLNTLRLALAHQPSRIAD